MAIYKNDARLDALWSLDEASGTRADYTANNNDLTDNNTVGRDAVNYQEGVASADFIAANHEYLSIPDAVQTGLDSPKTIVFWVKFHLAGGTSEGVMGKGEAAGSRQWQVYRRSSGSFPISFRASSDGTNYSTFYSDTGTSQDTWHHIGIVVNGTDVRFYRNGVADSAVPGAWASAIHGGGEGFALGDRAVGAWFFMDGQLDEVAVFNTALTEAEINDICTNGIQSVPGEGIGVGYALPVYSFPDDAWPERYWILPPPEPTQEEGVYVETAIPLAWGADYRISFRIILLDRNGTPRGELHQARSAAWSWVLNGEGAAEIVIDASDPRAIVDLLTHAPLIVIYSDTGNWGGILKRGIEQAGPQLTLRAWSNERLLRGRQTAQTRSLDNRTNGAIAQALLADANAEWPTLVSPGSYIYTAGLAHWYEVHYDDLLRRIQDMAAVDWHDFEVTWDRKLNWYERKGSDKPNVVLAEGRNVVRYPQYTYSEDTIVNDQHCVGTGASWATKLTSRVLDTTSQNAYGMWQAVTTYPSISDQDTLDLKAETLLDNRKDPSRRIDLLVVNKPAGLWNEFAEGDRVRVILPSYHLGVGFDEMVRVLSREVNASAGTMRVVVEVE